MMKTILVIGASGFVGRHLVKALLAEEYAVRCLARDPARVKDLAALGCEVVKGDISDPASVQQAVEGAQAVYISIHTLSPQPGSTPGQRFMAVELEGLQNVVTACLTHGVRRVIYVTSLGITAEASSEWLRERWRAEQFLLGSGLDVTMIRPGMIVGAGGRGFGMLASQAKRAVAVSLGGSQKMRSIAIDDLIYYLVGVLSDPRAYGQSYDVGNDDVLANGQMTDTVAEVLGGRPPRKLQLPPALLGAFAPLIERLGKLPGGAIKGIVDSVDADASGDPLLIRAILPRPLLSFREAAALAIHNKPSIK